LGPLLLKQTLGDGLVQLKDVGNEGGAFPTEAPKNLYGKKT